MSSVSARPNINTPAVYMFKSFVLKHQSHEKVWSLHYFDEVIKTYTLILHFNRVNSHLQPITVQEITFPTLTIWTYLPDIRTFGLSGPGDDARHGQARLAGVDEVRRVHLSSQTLDVFQNGNLHLKRGQQTFRYTFSRCIHHIDQSESFSHFSLPWDWASESDRRWTSSGCWTVGRMGTNPWNTKKRHIWIFSLTSGCYAGGSFHRSC